MIEDMPVASSRAPVAKPEEGYVWVVAAAGVSALILAIGLFIFASNVDSRELHHGWYLLAFFLSTAGLGAAIGYRQTSIAVFLGIVIALVLGVSLAKFSWHKSMLAVINDPNAQTVLGDYARNLPTLEEHWNPYDEAPDWVKFDEECFRPAMGQGSYAEACKNKGTIMGTYKIDVMQVINDRYNMMKETARRISVSEITTKDAYIGCLNSGACAPVPLLPAQVDPASIAASDPQYKEVRAAFWELIDSKAMTVGICETMPICRMLTQTGAITRNDFPNPAG